MTGQADFLIAIEIVVGQVVARNEVEDVIVDWVKLVAYTFAEVSLESRVIKYSKKSNQCWKCLVEMFGLQILKRGLNDQVTHLDIWKCQSVQFGCYIDHHGTSIAITGLVHNQWISAITTLHLVILVKASNGQGTFEITICHRAVKSDQKVGTVGVVKTGDSGCDTSWR